MNAHVPTSVMLRDLLNGAPPDHVTLGWILGGLRERSFGVIMILLALMALVPGLSIFIGLLLLPLAVQMILARRSPVLPRFVAGRRLQTRRLAHLIARVIPPLQRIEKLIRPRWPTPFEATKRVVGAVILLLSLTLIGPIPFSQVIPSLVIMLVALCYLEEDGVMLCIALTIAFVSLSMTAATVWATIAGVEFLEQL